MKTMEVSIKHGCRYILVVLFTITCNYGISQSFNGGILGGFTTSQVDGDEHNGFHRIGAYGGMFVQTHIHCFAPEFQLTFSQKGAASADKSFKTTIGYVDAKFLVNVFLHDFIAFVPSPLSLNVGTLVSAKAYENIRISDIKSTSSDFHRIDWQANAGVAYNLSDRLQLSADVSYSILPNSKRYYNFALWFGLKYALIANHTR